MQDKQDRALPRGAWYALLLVALTNAMSLLDRQILAILAPAIKKDLNVGDAEMGLLYGTVFALFYALFSLPVGRLADGWVRTRLLAISILFWSAATGLAGLTTSFALLALSRLGVGIGEAATQPGGTSLIYDYWPRERRGFVMAVMASAIALGLGGSLILGGLAAHWWDASYASGGAPLNLKGWQFAFLVAAAPGFVLAGFLWTLREPVRGGMDGITTPPDPHPFRASAELLGAVTPVLHWLAMKRRGASAGMVQRNHCGGDVRADDAQQCNVSAPADGSWRADNQSACAAMDGHRRRAGGDREPCARPHPFRSAGQPRDPHVTHADDVHCRWYAAVGHQLRDDGVQPHFHHPHLWPDDAGNRAQVRVAFGRYGHRGAAGLGADF
jgi:hypothetical protein